MSTAAAEAHPHEPGKAREAFRAVTRDVAWVAEAPKPHKAWLVALAISILAFAWGIYSIYKLLWTGIGVWGNSNTVAWAWDITNFVWWIGIGHAGTLISAVLYLTRQTWRVSINRSAEAMTIFAVMAAGLFPLLHTGRPWFAWWMIPLPNDMGSMWPQFRSPLMWDVFAVTTYLTTSVLFWYMGMVPDLATFRDRCVAQGKNIRAIIYGVLALGWRGSARDWRTYKAAYLIMAGIMAPMVVSVHSIVGLDFAAGIIAGWHSTQWPPYFFIGALYSGWAIVLVLIIPMRRLYRLERLITERHLNVIAKLMLTTGLMLAYCYLMDAMDAFYTGEAAKSTAFKTSAFGPYAAAYWARNTLNIFLPQLLWLPFVRRSQPMLFCLGLGVVVGMWLERYNFVVSALSTDYTPSEWYLYNATFWDWAILAGSVGLVMTGFFLFIRFFPVISMFEIREVVEKARTE